MVNYREFDAGPDPFGRTIHVLFKYQQNGISIRHADTVDVKFLLQDDAGGTRMERVIALEHAHLVRLSKEAGRKMDDAWCSRLAALHLVHLISTGEDMEKDLVTVPYADLQRYAGEVAREEKSEVGAR